MGQKDKIIEMARLRKAGEPEPHEGEVADDAEGDDTVEPGEDAAGERTPIPLSWASRFQRSCSMAPMVLSFHRRTGPEDEMDMVLS